MVTNLHFLDGLLGRAIAAGRRGRKEAASLWLLAALEELREQEKSGVTKADYHSTGIEAICDSIQRVPAYPWRVTELAARLHVCPDHFSRLFRRHTGVSPAEFIIRSRLETARNLLLHSNHQITRIAERSGYSNVYYFSRQFKARMGATPSEYRQHR